MKLDVLQSYTEKHLLLRMPFFQDADLTLVDVGAYHGYFSRSFAKRTWRILAFEPEPENFNICQRNLLKFPQAKCIQKAVSDISKTNTNFYVSTDHPGIHSLRPFHYSHQLTSVDTITLNDALIKYRIDQVTLLKVDVEGADFLVLKGLNFDIYHPDIVMVEFFDERSVPNFGYSHLDVVDYMEAFDYKAYVSEWATFEKYGNATSDHHHKFLGCQPYPLQHKPKWGNQIFVNIEKDVEFNTTLQEYLIDLESYKPLRIIEWYRMIAAKLPLLRHIVNRFRN